MDTDISYKTACALSSLIRVFAWALWAAKNPKRLHTGSKNSDQPSSGRTCSFVKNATSAYRINPVSILYKSIAGRYRHFRVADGPL